MPVLRLLVVPSGSERRVNEMRVFVRGAFAMELRRQGRSEMEFTERGDQTEDG